MVPAPRRRAVPIDKFTVAPALSEVPEMGRVEGPALPPDARNGATPRFRQCGERHDAGAAFGRKGEGKSRMTIFSDLFLRGEP